MAIGVGFIVALAILFTLIKWGLIVWGVVWLVRYLKRSREEKQRFRLELGKLAEEVHLLRKELRGDKRQPAPGQSE